MLEANREVKCDTKIQYKTKEEALKVPGQMKLSYETTQKYRAVRCPDCIFWHLLHISETMGGL